MNLSSVALGLLASSLAPEPAAATYGLRRGLRHDDGDHVNNGDDCWKAKDEAAELTKAAIGACGVVGASAADPATVLPNPTCLLLLCRAQQTGDYLVASSCAEEAVVERDAIFDLCPLVPGLLTPEVPVARDDTVVLDFDAAGRPSVMVDVLANDLFTFGQTLQVTSILEQRGPGTCEVMDNQVMYTPSFPDFDSGKIFCDYEACYEGRYVGLCANATLEVEVTGAPTASPSALPSLAPTNVPTGAPTVAPDPCDLGLAVTASPFPPAGFDPAVRCSRRPTRMTLKFNGGGCGQSDNSQGSDHFECNDRGEGPAAAGPHYIRVSNLDFAETVDVGDTFTLSYANDPDWFPSDVNVKIYADSTMEDLLQNVWFHSSCSKRLYLSDKFGSVQLVEYENSAQGTVSLNHLFETRIEITNNSTLVNVTVDELFFAVNSIGGIVEDVSNETLSFGMGLNYTTSDLVDATGPVVYLASVVAVGDNNITCSVNATDVLNANATGRGMIG